MSRPLDVQQQDLIRRRRMAEALMASGMAPLEAPPVRGARISPWEGVSKIAQSLMGNYQQRGIARDEDALATALSGQRRSSAMEMLGGVMPGAEGVGDEAAHRDRTAALADALASPDDQRRDMAKMAIAEALVREKERRKAEADAAETVRTRTFTAEQNAPVRQIQRDAEARAGRQEMEAARHNTETERTAAENARRQANPTADVQNMREIHGAAWDTMTPAQREEAFIRMDRNARAPAPVRPLTVGGGAGGGGVYADDGAVTPERMAGRSGNSQGNYIIDANTGEYINPAPEPQPRAVARTTTTRASMMASQNPEPYVEALRVGSLTPATVPAEIRDKVLKIAQERKIHIVSDKEREAIAAFDSAIDVLDNIRELSEKIHVDEGLTARVGGAIRRGAAYAGYDSDVRLLQSKAGELSLLIRALGEKGALAEGDVKRASALVPTSPTMTKTEAEGMLKSLQDILVSAASHKFKSATQAVAEPGGTKNDPLGVR